MFVRNHHSKPASHPSSGESHGPLVAAASPARSRLSGGPSSAASHPNAISAPTSEGARVMKPEARETGSPSNETPRPAPVTGTPGAAAQPRHDDAAAQGGGLLDGMQGWLSDVARDPAGAMHSAGDKLRHAVMEKTGLAPTKDEMAAMKTVHDMLGTDKLGGKDRTFNQNDSDAIGRSIGQNMGGIKGRIASRVAPGKINEGLAKAGISPSRNEPDATPRQVTREDMDRFQAAAEKGLEGYSKRIAQNPLAKPLGLDKQMRPPHGLAQDDVKAIMEGRKPQGWVESQ